MRNNIDTETKTILHYAKKIREYCEYQGDVCEKCQLLDGAGKCYFHEVPFLWEEVNLHDE